MYHCVQHVALEAHTFSSKRPERIGLLWRSSLERDHTMAREGQSKTGRGCGKGDDAQVGRFSCWHTWHTLACACYLLLTGLRKLWASDHGRHCFGPCKTDVPIVLFCAAVLLYFRICMLL